MALQTYVGPQEQVFPHLRALEGVTGTLVLRPGEDYDFDAQPEGYRKPPGPAWWWKPADPPARPAAAIAASPVKPAAGENAEG